MSNRKKYDWKEIQQAYDTGLSFRELKLKFGLAANSLSRAVKRNELIPRQRGQTVKIKVILGWIKQNPEENQKFYQSLMDGSLKLCVLCHTPKPIGSYNKNAGRTDGLQTQCRTCGQDKSKNYYSYNQEKHVIAARNRKVRRIKENKNKFYEFLVGKSCVNCGETNPLTFDMDHIEIKKENISTLIGTGICWETILKEIAKCQLLCANCHRIKTHTERKTTKYRYFVLNERD